MHHHQFQNILLRLFFFIKYLLTAGVVHLLQSHIIKSYSNTLTCWNWDGPPIWIYICKKNVVLIELIVLIKCFNIIEYGQLFVTIFMKLTNGD